MAGIYYYPRVDNLTLTASSLAPFSGFSHILFQANNSITLAPGETLALGAGSGQLTLEAGGDITFGTGSQITDANNWSATLDAGYNFANHTVQSGVGNIYLNGGSGQSGIGSIQLSQAAIKLTAGNSIVVGSGCQLVDDGGTIGLYAPTVNQNGLIQANSVGNQTVSSNSSPPICSRWARIPKSPPMATIPHPAARRPIMLNRANIFRCCRFAGFGGGGANGGNGGRILTYAASLSVNSHLDVSAPAGSAGNEYYYPFLTKTLTLTASKLAPFAGFSSILFDVGDITIAAGTIDLGVGSGLLTLEAGGDITFANGSKITDANNWSVNLGCRI